MGNAAGILTIVFFVRELKVQKTVMNIFGLSLIILANAQAVIIIVMHCQVGEKMIGIHILEK